MDTNKVHDLFSENGIFLVLFCSLAIAPFILYLHGGLGVDEGFYLFKGYSILEGSLQNHDYWLIGVYPAFYFLLAGIFLLFGKTYIIPRMLIFGLNALSAFLVYKIGKTCWNGSIGKISSILFLFAMILPTFEMAYLLLEPFVIFLCLISIYLFIKSDNTHHLVIIGGIIGIGILFKTVALLFLCGLIGYYFFNWVFYGKRKPEVLKLSIIRIFYVISGICVPITTFAFYFWKIGAINNFLIATGNLAIERGLSINLWNFQSVFIAFIILWIFLFVTIIFFIKACFNQEYDKNVLLFISMLTCFSLPLLSRQYGHYFTLILPYACLLAALSFEKLKFALNVEWGTKKIDCRIFVIIVALLLIIPSVNFFLESEQYYQQGSVTLLNDQISTSQYIVEHTAENDKIFVFDYEPSIYFFTGRDPATNSLIFDFSSLNTHYMPEKQVIAILKNTTPYVIVKNGDIYNPFYPNISEYIHQNYHLVISKGRFDIYK